MIPGNRPFHSWEGTVLILAETLCAFLGDERGHDCVVISDLSHTRDKVFFYEK